MKTFELTGTLRSEFGKKAAKGLRKQDQVPCNIYGANGNQTFTVNVADIRKLIYTPDTQIVALDIEGQKRMA
ncbi:MAG: 50S ribosomal protein L25, partial [Paludibacteraceae bacterium]|nr:50S ribosomal protein L25 [Paludibacteraceae bacterium]